MHEPLDILRMVNWNDFDMLLLGEWQMFAETSILVRCPDTEPFH